MRLELRWRTGALSAGIALACAVAACSNSREPGPGTGPSGACAPNVQPSQAVVDLSAQQIRLTVTAPASCRWAVKTPAWVSSVSKDGGAGTYSNAIGSGEVTLLLQVAAATSARQGWFSVVAGDYSTGATVFQEAECMFRTDPPFLEFDAAGGIKSARLTALPSCAWSLAMPAWIRVEPASGTGSTALMIEVAPADSPRVGLVSTAGRSLGIRQTPAGMSPVLAFEQVWCGTIRPGETKVALCHVYTAPATNPISSGVGLTLDIRSLGGSESFGLNPDIGTFGLGFLVDMGVAASVLPGLREIPMTVRDAQGRTASATMLLNVLPPK